MFLFVYVCDLLEKLQGLHDARLLLPNDLITRTNDHVVHWLRQHSNKLNPFETDKDGVIRCLRPEKSFGWEYGLDTQRLEQIIARVLALSRQRYAELQRWQHDTSAGDLGVCVEKVMRDLDIPPRSLTDLTNTNDIDQALLEVAANQPSSSELVRSLALPGDNNALVLLGGIYRKLQPREAKWFTRLIMRDYGPVVLPDKLIDRSNHAGVPGMVETTFDFKQASTIPIRRIGASMMKSTQIPRIVQFPTPPSTASTVSSSSQAVQAPSKLSSRAPARNTPKVLRPSLTTTLATPHPRLPLTPLSINSPIKQRPNIPQPQSTLTSCTAVKTTLTTSNVLASTSRPAPLSATSPTRASIRSSHSNIKVPNLTNAIILISSAVSPSPSPSLIQSMTTQHAATFTTSSQHFLCSSSKSRRFPTKTPLRKIVLVEPRDKEQSLKVLRGIMRLQEKRREGNERRLGRNGIIKRTKGERESIEVYDWRLLECIAKMDRGRVFEWDIWGRCWIGWL